MKKFEIGQGVSILANVGVILGLVLLSIEIHQSNELAAAAAYQTRVNEVDVSLQQYALSDVLPALYSKLEQSGLASLNVEELERLRAWELARRIRMQGQHYQYGQGYLDRSAYQEMLGAARESVDLWLELGINSREDEFVRAILDSEE